MNFNNVLSNDILSNTTGCKNPILSYNQQQNQFQDEYSLYSKHTPLENKILTKLVNENYDSVVINFTSNINSLTKNFNEKENIIKFFLRKNNKSNCEIGISLNNSNKSKENSSKAQNHTNPGNNINNNNHNISNVNANVNHAEVNQLNQRNIRYFIQDLALSISLLQTANPQNNTHAVELPPVRINHRDREPTNLRDATNNNNNIPASIRNEINILLERTRGMNVMNANEVRKILESKELEGLLTYLSKFVSEFTEKNEKIFKGIKNENIKEIQQLDKEDEDNFKNRDSKNPFVGNQFGASKNNNNSMKQKETNKNKQEGNKKDIVVSSEEINKKLLKASLNLAITMNSLQTTKKGRKGPENSLKSPKKEVKQKEKEIAKSKYAERKSENDFEEEEADVIHKEQQDREATGERKIQGKNENDSEHSKKSSKLHEKQKYNIIEITKIDEIFALILSFFLKIDTLLHIPEYKLPKYSWLKIALLEFFRDIIGPVAEETKDTKEILIVIMKILENPFKIPAVEGNHILLSKASNNSEFQISAIIIHKLFILYSTGYMHRFILNKTNRITKRIFGDSLFPGREQEMIQEEYFPLIFSESSDDEVICNNNNNKKPRIKKEEQSTFLGDFPRLARVRFKNNRNQLSSSDYDDSSDSYDSDYEHLPEEPFLDNIIRHQIIRGVLEDDSIYSIIVKKNKFVISPLKHENYKILLIIEYNFELLRHAFNNSLLEDDDEEENNDIEIGHCYQPFSNEPPQIISINSFGLFLSDDRMKFKVLNNCFFRNLVDEGLLMIFKRFKYTKEMILNSNNTNTTKVNKDIQKNSDTNNDNNNNNNNDNNDDYNDNDDNDNDNDNEDTESTIDNRINSHNNNINGKNKKYSEDKHVLEGRSESRGKSKAKKKTNNKKSKKQGNVVSDDFNSKIQDDDAENLLLDITKYSNNFFPHNISFIQNNNNLTKDLENIKLFNESSFDELSNHHSYYLISKPLLSTFILLKQYLNFQVIDKTNKHFKSFFGGENKNDTYNIYYILNLNDNQDYLNRIICYFKKKKDFGYFIIDKEGKYGKMQNCKDRICRKDIDNELIISLYNSKETIMRKSVITVFYYIPVPITVHSSLLPELFLNDKEAIKSTNNESSFYNNNNDFNNQKSIEPHNLNEQQQQHKIKLSLINNMNYFHKLFSFLKAKESQKLRFFHRFVIKNTIRATNLIEFYKSAEMLNLAGFGNYFINEARLKANAPLSYFLHCDNTSNNIELIKNTLTDNTAKEFLLKTLVELQTEKLKYLIFCASIFEKMFMETNDRFKVLNANCIFSNTENFLNAQSLLLSKKVTLNFTFSSIPMTLGEYFYFIKASMKGYLRISDENENTVINSSVIDKLIQKGVLFKSLTVELETGYCFESEETQIAHQKYRGINSINGLKSKVNRKGNSKKSMNNDFEEQSSSNQNFIRKINFQLPTLQAMANSIPEEIYNKSKVLTEDLTKQFKGRSLSKEDIKWLASATRELILMNDSPNGNHDVLEMFNLNPEYLKNKKRIKHLNNNYVSIFTYPQGEDNQPIGSFSFNIYNLQMRIFQLLFCLKKLYANRRIRKNIYASKSIMKILSKFLILKTRVTSRKSGIKYENIYY